MIKFLSGATCSALVIASLLLIPHINIPSTREFCRSITLPQTVPFPPRRV